MVATTDLRDIPFRMATGAVSSLAAYPDRVVLVVNVASKCGLTPQYQQLEALQQQYRDRGFTVLGFPCNQFLGQEPGSMEQILEYCATTWGVSFPIADKIKVNGKNATQLYQALKQIPDADGSAGRVTWNFEKFLVTPAGDVFRFRPKTTPDHPDIVRRIEEHLPH